MGELKDQLKLFISIVPSQRGYRPRTLRQYRWTCERFLSFVGEESPLSAFNEQNILGYQAKVILDRERQGEPPLSASSLNSYRDAFMAFGSWLEQRKLLSDNPARCLQLNRRADPKRAEITDEVAFGMIDACDLIKSDRRRLLCRAVLSVLTHSGVRISELLDLRLEDYHQSERALFVRCGKGGKSRSIPICSACVQAIEEYLSSRPPDCRPIEKRKNNLFMLSRQVPVGHRTVTTIIAQCACLIRYKGHVTPHAFRHAYATRLIRNSHNDVATVSKLLGHSRISTTHDLYTHTNAERLRAVSELSATTSTPVPSPPAPATPPGSSTPAHRPTRSRRVALRRLSY
jgi:integrase/recombinase XerC